MLAKLNVTKRLFAPAKNIISFRATSSAPALRQFSTKRYTSAQEVPTQMLTNQQVFNTPQNKNNEDFVQYLYSVLYPMVSEISWDDQTQDVVVHIYPQYIRNVAKVLRDHQRFQYKQLIDVTCVDTLSNSRRFDVVWLFLSVQFQHRITVRTSVDDGSGVDSLTPLFHSAMWAEREAWDMFGVFFKGHPDLRRILTDYGFDGHPLRKDFPLGGYNEIIFDPIIQMVKYVSPPVFREEYRDFENIETEWEDIYHRRNTAWSYDKMVDRQTESAERDHIYNDTSINKVKKQSTFQETW